MAKKSRRSPINYFKQNSTTSMQTPAVISIPAAASVQSNLDLAEQQLLTDERIQAKLMELEQERLDMEETYRQKTDGAEAEYERRKRDLDERANTLDERETGVLEAEEVLNEHKRIARDEAIAAIRAEERELRQAEYQRLISEWEQEAQEKLSSLERDLANQRAQVDVELCAAHDALAQAESEKVSRIHAADKEILGKYEQFTKEYQELTGQLRQAIREQLRLRSEVEIKIEEQEGDREYLEQLKEKYKSCSESEVLKLREQVKSLEIYVQTYEERISELRQQVARYEVREAVSNGQSAQAHIDELEGRLREAEDRLDEYADMPSSTRIAELQLCETALRQCQNELDELKGKYAEVQNRLNGAALSHRELENARVTASALEVLNDQLQKKLRYISDQYKSASESKFPGLLAIDKEQAARPSGKIFSGSLQAMVQYIRSYGASNTKHPLFYSEETIRVFVASLAASEPASRLLILQGLSGTGKSSLPRLFGEALGFTVNLVSVQPSWRDNRELLGYDNDFTNRFKETEFTKCVYRASAPIHQNQITLIVLDEMNLARIEYYFADFLSILEMRNAHWLVELIPSYSEDEKPRYLNYDDEAASLVVGKNVWFIGTANNDDSTSLITDKVYDRAQILDMDSREPDFTGEKLAQQYLDLTTLQTLFHKARNDKDACMKPDDWTKLTMIDKSFLQPMDITFGNRIKTQLQDFVPVYVACGGTKEGAMDYYLAHKILRKLEEKYDAYVLRCLDDLEMGLIEIFGSGTFTQCIKKIRIIRKRNFNAGNNE